MKRILHVAGFTALLLGIASTSSHAAQTAVPTAADTDDRRPAALTGTVRDSSGATIPQPTIIVRQEPSGLEHVVAGAADGTFFVALLVSFGGIERGLRERLEGLTYTSADAGLLPDRRIVAWVLAMAE